MLRLRPATPADLPTLRHWDEQPHVQFSDPNDEDWDWAAELALDPDWREQLIAEREDGTPLGFVQIIDPHREDTQYWGEDSGPEKRAIDIWIGAAEHLGRGYGTRMMELALARCFADPRVTEVLIDPLVRNGRSIRFYQRLGFRFLEERWFGKDHCAVYVLSRTDWIARKP